MARRHRKKPPNILEVAFACGMLVALLSIANPQVRSALHQLGTIVIWSLIGSAIVTLLVAVAYVIHRAGRSAAPADHEQPSPAPLTSHTPPPNDDFRYMPKEPGVIQCDDSRYMPKPQKSLAQQIHAIDWFQFEKLVEFAYAPTHKVTRRGGAKADGGIDLVIDDASGQTAVQCKHWKSWKVHCAGSAAAKFRNQRFVQSRFI